MATIARSAPLTSLGRSLIMARRSQAILPQLRFASGDYGSGTGDPKGEKPQEQGPNPSADKEHPGPPPPKAGQGSGGATKATQEGHDKSSQGQGQKRSFSTTASSSTATAIRRSLGVRGYHSTGAVAKEKMPKSTEGLSPKILSASPPADDEQPEDVRKHNEEMKNRAEKAALGVANKDAERDKVSPKFWSGHGGVSDSDKKAEEAKG